MRATLHEASPSSPVLDHCTGSGHPRMAEQLDLSPALHWQAKGARIRALLCRAIVANGLSHADLSRDTGIDERQIARALTDHGGAHPPLPLVACVLWNDKAGIFITGLAEMLGYEAQPRTPDLAAENRALREKLAAAAALPMEASR